MCRFGLCMTGRKNAFTVLALEPLSVVCWGFITPVSIRDARKINQNGKTVHRGTSLHIFSDQITEYYLSAPLRSDLFLCNLAPQLRVKT